ncbi:hypothetical protein [Streptomyces sp. H27-H5]|uniref:hypothetical protein n=1 Tax=Streptomyces sp. H27-H5 TaxID=2996460 RepID=UPI0022711018|nr:hypothetical protein [Streptomyces sp. H27-H5]MCY0956382.1 hypothetical protein [Streptomyces sp. H27-H5]
MDDNAFEELVSGIEVQMNSELLQKKGAYAVTAAKISGLVLTEAVATGVPASVAQEMASDTWIGLMGFPVLTETDSEDSE